MRTKRIASVVLAVLMTLSVFGVIGASAAADKGWGAVTDGFALAESSKGADNKEVYWEAFAAGDTAADKDFWTLNALPANDPGRATYTWTVKWVGEDGKQNVSLVPGNANSGISELKEKSANKLTLIVTPSKDGRYGEYQVTLQVKVGEEPKTSKVFSVYLIDDSEYKAKLAEAEAIAKNPDNRYTSAYIDNLNLVIKTVKQTVSGADVTQDRYVKAIKDLDAAIKAVEYQLTGVGFIDDLFDQGTLVTIWGVVDTANEAIEFYNKYLGEDSWIYKNITSKIDMGQVFKGLFNGLIALFALI